MLGVSMLRVSGLHQMFRIEEKLDEGEAFANANEIDDLSDQPNLSFKWCRAITIMTAVLSDPCGLGSRANL